MDIISVKDIIQKIKQVYNVKTDIQLRSRRFRVRIPTGVLKKSR